MNTFFLEGIYHFGQQFTSILHIKYRYLHTYEYYICKAIFTYFGYVPCWNTVILSLIRIESCSVGRSVWRWHIRIKIENSSSSLYTRTGLFPFMLTCIYVSIRLMLYPNSKLLQKLDGTLTFVDSCSCRI